MTSIKRRANGTIEVIEDERVAVGPGESVFASATEQAASLTIPVWKAGTLQNPISYNTEDVYTYNNKLWKCINPNTPSGDTSYAPGTAWSLWVEIWPSGVIPNWRQPLGGHDAYPANFEVYHEPTERIWVSNIDNNVWEPNSSANTWTLREDQNPLTPENEWNGNFIRYEVGNEVTYNGFSWRCVFAHTSQPTWYPGAPGIFFWEQI